MNEIFTLNYYFFPSPPTSVDRYEWVITFAIGLVVLGVLLYVYRRKFVKDKKAKKILKPYPGRLITYGIIAFFLLFCRMAGLPYFAMRIWWIILFVIILYQFIKLLRAWIKKDKGFQKKEKKADPNEKYLPKKKKR